jgi:hypothetical protein
MSDHWHEARTGSSLGSEYKSRSLSSGDSGLRVPREPRAQLLVLARASGCSPQTIIEHREAPASGPTPPDLGGTFVVPIMIRVFPGPRT